MIHGFNVKFEAGRAHLTVSATLSIPQARRSVDAVQPGHSSLGHTHTIHDILSAALSELVFGRIQPALQANEAAPVTDRNQPLGSSQLAEEIVAET
jgi:hypothetical protein